MADMLANRYLLNGFADEALIRYRAALESQPDQPELQCRLILAQLELARADEVAGFVLGVLRDGGPTGLARLRQGCRGFVPNDKPKDPEALIGLRALLAGDWTRARVHLGRVPAAVHPAVAELAEVLESIDGD